MRSILVVWCVLGVVLAEKVRYDGFKVFRVIPASEEHVHVLKDLEDTNMAYSFWRSPSAVGRPIDIMVAPHLVNQFKDFLNLHGLEARVSIENVQDNIDNERPKQRQGRGVGWEDYHTLDEIYEWLGQVAAENPNTVTLVNAGWSYENRSILGLHISFSPENANRAVYIESGIHAREWIAPAVTTYIINAILTSNETAIRNTVEGFDWYIFPVYNPDGYVYSFTNDRMWRKTRTTYTPCVGADPNRNWPYKWNTGGTSNNTCSEIFRGPNPLSERCVATAASYFSSVARNVKIYISFHSFGQMFLIPFGHTSEELGNFQQLYDISVKAAESLAVRYGTQYRVGNIVQLLSVATGNSVDWVKANFDIPFTYIYELRDTGTHAFILPAEQIAPSARETLDSFLTLIDESAAALP